MSDAANDPVYCRFCNDTGRVRGLTEQLEPTIDPCVFCQLGRVIGEARDSPEKKNPHTHQSREKNEGRRAP